MKDDGLRLELAEQRMRIMRLEHQLALHADTLTRMTDLLDRHVGPAVVRADLVAQKHEHIRALAGFLGSGCTEVIVRKIEKLYARELAVPPEAEGVVAQLRAAYGAGGPSRSTIRRVLSKIPNADEYSDAAA